jgi:hypothetical protein
MLKRLSVLVLALALVVSVGCVVPRNGAVFAPVMMVKSPLAVGDTTVGMSKMGEAMAEGIIVVSRGDASISAAMKNGGITKIHHVDSEEFSVLGLYCTETTRVYGE